MNVAAPDAGHLDNLAACLVSGNDTDSAAAYAERTREQPDQRVVGGVIDRGGLQSYDQRTIQGAGDFRSARARAHAHVEPDRAAVFRAAQLAHIMPRKSRSSRLSAKYAMIGVMSIIPIVGTTCRNGRRSHSVSTNDHLIHGE